MIFTDALSQTMWPQLVACLTFMCSDSLYLLLRCGSGAPPVAVAYYNPEIQLFLGTAANYFVDFTTTAQSRFNAAEFGAVLVADCIRKQDMYVLKPWSD